MVLGLDKLELDPLLNKLVAGGVRGTSSSFDLTLRFCMAPFKP